ncbi:MAG TPA: replicative DNA helicase [Alphaproteobacteria bacterium]|nr:replicative DNA helicase [Alphaproteobacteria bacterium]
MEPARTNVSPLKTRDEDALSLRSPPHNFEAEVQLLGAILANNRAFEKVADFLQPDHFTDPRHARIFDACGKLINRGQIASATTLKNFFEQDATLTEIGGPAYLGKLAAAAVTIINVADHGRIVHDLYLRRQLIGLGEDVVNRAYAHDLETAAKDQIELAEQTLFDLATKGEGEGGLKPLVKATAEAVKMAEAAHKRNSHVTGVTTGLIDLDRKLGGLHPSDLIILAGRPGMGKSALATKMAYSAAKARHDAIEARKQDPQADNDQPLDGGVVALFSLEMSAEQLATRLLAEKTEISADDIRRGAVKSTDFQKFVAASAELENLRLFIDDTPALTVPLLRMRARRLKRTHGLDMIVIDYLQLLGSPAGSRPENRVQEISAITRGLKALAKELNVPVLALSQLSRAVEQREDKRPQLADLRESGTIEQDADVVMFVYRQAYYEREPERREDEPNDKFVGRMADWQEKMNQIHNLADVIIAKQRHGPTGTVKLLFEGRFTKFDNLAQDGSDQPPDGD